MAKLPKSLIKKYGISKKAWAVFRAGKGKSKSRVRTSSRKTRKTQSRGLYMAKKRRTSRSKSGFMGKVGKILLGVGVAAAYEVFLSPMIPLNRNIKNIVEMILGVVVAAMPRLPMAIRAGGAAIATINAFEILVPLLRGFGQKASTGGLNLAMIE